jgi:hypothetical protein
MDKNSVSLAGEFAVLSQLVLKGFNANMTLGKTKGVDIIGYCDNGKMFRLEVKTRRENDKPKSSKLFGKYNCSWLMDEKHEEIHYANDNLFFCFVKIENDTKFRFFIVPNRKVVDYIKKQEKYWLDADKKHNSTKMREFRLSLKENSSIPDSLKLIDEEYEDKWEILKQSNK